MFLFITAYLIWFRSLIINKKNFSQETKVKANEVEEITEHSRKTENNDDQPDMDDFSKFASQRSKLFEDVENLDNLVSAKKRMMTVDSHDNDHARITAPSMTEKMEPNTKKARSDKNEGVKNYVKQKDAKDMFVSILENKFCT